MGKTIIPEAAVFSLLYNQESKDSISDEDAESLFFKLVEIDVSLKRMNLDLWAAVLKRKEESKAETQKINEEMHLLMKLTEQISLAMDEILMENCLEAQKQMLLQLFLANREAAHRLQQLQYRINDLAVSERNLAAAFKKAQLDIAKRMEEMISLFNPTHADNERNQTHPTV